MGKSYRKAEYCNSLLTPKVDIVHLRVDFEPATQKAVRATNTDVASNSTTAASTFDNSKGSVKFAAITNQAVLQEVVAGAQWIVGHLQDVFANTVKVTRFSAFFRQDPGNRLWLNLVTNMAYEGPLPSTQMPAKVVPSLFDTDALWNAEQAKLAVSLKRFSESKELQSPSILRLLTKAGTSSHLDSPEDSVASVPVSPEVEWLNELKARRPNMPIPRDVHGMIKLVANQCPSCGAKLRENQSDQIEIPLVPRKTVILHYQQLLSKLRIKPFDMSFAQEKQMEGNLTAVKKPSKCNMWPTELDAQIAAGGAGLYGVYALSMEQTEQLAAKRPVGDKDSELKFVVREVPPIISMLQPGLGGPELQGLRKDPTWLLHGVEVCSNCYEVFAPILSMQMTADTRGVSAQQILGPPISRHALERPKSIRIKQELEARRDQRKQRAEQVQHLQQKLRQHAANSKMLDGSETVFIGSLALNEREASLAAELFVKGQQDEDDLPFGGTAASAPVGFNYASEAPSAPVPETSKRAGDPLLHMLQRVQWAAREQAAARTEVKPCGGLVLADTKEVLGAAEERNRLRADTLPAQVKAFQKYEAAKKRATEAWQSGEEPTQADSTFLAAGPPPTPGLVAIAAVQRSASAPLGMSRKQLTNAAWQTKKQSSEMKMSETAGQIERAKILARSVGGTTFAQPRGVVLSYNRPQAADLDEELQKRPQFTNQVGPGATNLLSTWLAATEALGGPDKKLSTIGSGKVSDPSLARVFGNGKTRKVRRSPFLAPSIVPVQGTHRSMTFTPVTRPHTTQALRRPSLGAARLPFLQVSQQEQTQKETACLVAPPAGVTFQPSSSGLFPVSLGSAQASDETRLQQVQTAGSSRGHHAELSPEQVLDSPKIPITSPAATIQRSNPGSPGALLGSTGRSLLPDLQAASHTANSITFKDFPSTRETKELIVSMHRARKATVVNKPPLAAAAGTNPHELGDLLTDDFIAAGAELSFRNNSIESAYSRLSEPDSKKSEKQARKRLHREKARVTAAADAYIAADTIRKRNAQELCESMLEAEVERQRRMAELEEQRQRRRQEKELAMRMSVSQGRPAADLRLKASQESKLALGKVEETMLYSADALNIRVGEGFTRMPSRFAVEAEKRRRKREVEAQQRAAKREGADTGEVVLTEDEQLLAGVLGSSKLLKPDASTGILACKMQVAKLGEFKANASTGLGSESAKVWLLVVRRAMLGEYQPTHEQAVIGMASLSALRDFGAGQGGALGDDPELVRKAALELAGAQSRMATSKPKEQQFSVSKSDIHNVEVMWGRGMYCFERLDVHSGAVSREYMSRHDLWQRAERDPLLLQAKRSELMWKSAVEGAGIDFVASQFCVRVLPPVSVSTAATELAILPPHPVRLGTWKDIDEQNELSRLRRGATSAFTHEGRKRLFDKRREASTQRLQAMAASKDVDPIKLQEELTYIHKTQLVKQLAVDKDGGSDTTAQPVTARMARAFGTLRTAQWIKANFPSPAGVEEHPNLPPIDPALGPSCWPHIAQARAPGEPAPSTGMLSSLQGPGGAWPSDVAAALSKVCIVPNTIEGIISGGLFFKRGGFHSLFIRGHSSSHPVDGKPFTLFHYAFISGQARCVQLSFYDLITDEIVKEVPVLIRQARCFYASLVLSIPSALQEQQLVSRPQTAPVFRIAHLKEPSEDEDIETRHLKKHTDVAVVPAKFQRGSLASMVKMHGRSMVYYTLRANEQYPHTFSIRTHRIGERKNGSRDLPQQSVESSSQNPFISKFAKPLVTAFGMDVGRQVLAARIRHIDDVPWLLALCVGHPRSSRTFGPLQARSERLSAHFKLTNPARASSPRGDRDGYDIRETLQQKADMDDTLGTFHVLTVRLVRQGDWTETGHCVEFPDVLPTEAHEDSDPEAFGSIELSYGKAATATVNPLLEHAGNAPPPTAIKLEQRQRKLESDYYLQQGAVVNEEEFIKQAMEKAQMLASMEQVDIEKRFRNSSRPQMIRAVDAAIGFAAGKITERPSIGLDSVFTQFSGDEAFADASGGAWIR